MRPAGRMTDWNWGQRVLGEGEGVQGEGQRGGALCRGC